MAFTASFDAGVSISNGCKSPDEELVGLSDVGENAPKLRSVLPRLPKRDDKDSSGLNRLDIKLESNVICPDNMSFK